MRLASISAHLPKSRFAALPAWGAALLLAALLALMGYGLVATARTAAQPAAASAASSNSDETDLRLYKAIATRVAAGEGYYGGGVAEQRRRGYPLHPFVTVRLPTLAMIHAYVGVVGAAILLWGLCLGVWFLMDRHLRDALTLERYSPYTCLPVAVALSPCLAPESLYWHEPLAMVLMTLALLLRTRERWLVAVLVGLAAVCVRELALPFLFVMAVTAAWDGTRRECLAWIAAIGAAALVLAGHAYLLSGVVTAADKHSPGWTSCGGWAFVLTMAKNFTGFAIFPISLIAILFPLALLGLAGWRGSLGLRAALTFAGYTCAFMVFGRWDNDYWGMLLSPFLPLGVTFAPGAVRDLVGAVRAAWAPRDQDAIA